MILRSRNRRFRTKFLQTLFSGWRKGIVAWGASLGRRMISFSNIQKQYGKQLIFVEASFQLNPGEKVGLVGPNGAGKTTLFRMIMNEETADDGDISVPKKLTIGYFRQDVDEMAGRPVLDEAIAAGELTWTLPPLPIWICSTVVAPKVSRKNRMATTQNTGLRN